MMVIDECTAENKTNERLRQTMTKHKSPMVWQNIYKCSIASTFLWDSSDVPKILLLFPSQPSSSLTSLASSHVVRELDRSPSLIECYLLFCAISAQAVCSDTAGLQFAMWMDLTGVDEPLAPIGALWKSLAAVLITVLSSLSCNVTIKISSRVELKEETPSQPFVIPAGGSTC